MHNQFKTQKFKHLMLAMGPRDLNSAPYSPVHCSSHSMTSFQSSELTELAVVENSQLFAQRTVRPLWTPRPVQTEAKRRKSTEKRGLMGCPSFKPALMRGPGALPYGRQASCAINPLKHCRIGHLSNS